MEKQSAHRVSERSQQQTDLKLQPRQESGRLGSREKQTRSWPMAGSKSRAEYRVKVKTVQRKQTTPAVKSSSTNEAEGQCQVDSPELEKLVQRIKLSLRTSQIEGSLVDSVYFVSFIGPVLKNVPDHPFITLNALHGK